MDNNERYQYYYEMLENGFLYYLPNIPIEQARIFDAMHYTLIGGGKHLRGMLVLEFCRVCGGNIKNALPFACAAEMIHTYSLIHDDLPCMDNDDIRRGHPANHKVFGEYMAVLAGDALLNTAFETILDLEHFEDFSPKTILKAAHTLAWSAGPYGMIGGQVLDMDWEGTNLSVNSISLIHSLKTGALINACAEIGCIIAGADAFKTASAVNFAQYLGFAFQIKDDILDVSGNPLITGKAIGRDAKSDKLTFASALGTEECVKIIGELTERAVRELKAFEDNSFLFWLAETMAKREN